MSNIEFIDSTVKIGELGSIMIQEYAVIKTLLSLGDVDKAVNQLVLRCGYSPNVAKQIVYELI